MNSKMLLLAPIAALAAGATVLPVAQADTGWTYEANLAPINGSGASGSLWLTLQGNQATVTQKVSGLASTFMDAPYPHVQHIHGGAMGMCPDTSADSNGDGVVSTTEGAPHYGGIVTTLSVKGDTSPAAGVDVKAAPTGSEYTYKRTISLDAKSVEALKKGTAVVVVHGLDPAKIPAAARAAKSDLVPSLPLAATSPALCGKLNRSQMNEMPDGGVPTGGGSTASGSGDTGAYYAGGGALLMAAGALLVTRRRFSKQH